MTALMKDPIKLQRARALDEVTALINFRLLWPYFKVVKGIRGEILSVTCGI